MNILKQPSVGFRPAAFLSGSPGPWASHLPFAADLIAALRPRVLVDVGVCYGDSYFGFCQAVAEAGVACTCYGIDAFDEAAGYETVSRYNDRLYRSFSHVLRIGFEEALDQFSNESVGLLHINAFRAYDDARRGFDNWLRGASPESAQALEQRLAQAEQQIERSAKDHARTQAEHRVLTQQLAIAKGNVEELTGIEWLTTIQAQSHAELVEARKGNARLTAMIEQERMLRAVLENSYSWQLTRPLRAVIALFRPDARN
jgi:hypothetical protein